MAVPWPEATARPAARSEDALGWLASSRIVLALILGYLALHFALRLMIAPALGIDDAEQALFAQSWSWSYRFRQPPLVTWLALALFELLGPGILALSILRYVMLGLTYLCLYLLARRWLADPRLAALSVFSFALIYLFAFYAHHDLTHTTALGAMIALTFYVFARLIERPGVRGYALLGVCFGLGLLAKWNFVMLAAGLPLTCLLWPGFRRLVLTWKTLLAGALMVLIATPSVLWVASQRAFFEVTGDTLGGEPQQGFPSRLAEGTAELVEAALTFTLPFLPLFLIVFGPTLWRGLRAPGSAAAAAATAPAPRMPPAFLGALILIVLALNWLLVPTLGAVAFHERWMHPALMILPVFLFALLDRARPSPGALRIYLALIAVVVVGTFGARIGVATLGAETCNKCRDLIRFDQLADGLRAAGFDHGTIVVPPDDFHIGGNLRVFFQASRIIDPAYPASVWPQPTPGGQCLIVWQPGLPWSGNVRADLEAYLARALDVPADAVRTSGQLDAAIAGSNGRSYTLAYLLLPEGPGRCH